MVASSYHRAQHTARIIAETIGYAGGIWSGPICWTRHQRARNQPYRSMRASDWVSRWEWRPARASRCSTSHGVRAGAGRLVEAHPGRTWWWSATAASCSRSALGAAGRGRACACCEVLVVTHAPGEAWRLAELSDLAAPAGPSAPDGGAATLSRRGAGLSARQPSTR
jgi:hypothetical protein